MAGAAAPLRIAVVFRNFGYVRLFDRVVRALLDDGHHVHLLHERQPASPTESRWLEELSGRPAFSATFTDAIERDRWSALADFLRRASDYAYARSSTFVGGAALVDRTEVRVDPRVLRLLEPLTRRPSGVPARLLRRLLDALERAIPTNGPLVEELRRLEPDLLVVAPHLMPGSRHEEYVDAAHAVSVPVCMCIASWDNLTTKQQIRSVPDRLVVWNDVQLREAVDLHGVPAERVVVTGAQPFDEWFGREASPREAFTARVGLPGAAPYVLYVAGALFPAARTEAEWVRDAWLPALRADERLRDVEVLVRPHPRRAEEWRAVSLDGDERVAVFPAQDAPMPVDEETRRDFHDSIHHSAAVVGINTSAMIEAATVGRPVLTVLAGEFHASQRGTHHFNYLLEVGGGVVDTAETLSEHLDQLAAVVAGRDESAARRASFLERFVRPNGLASPSLPYVVEAIETAAELVPGPPPRLRPGQSVLRGSLRALIAVTRTARRLRPGR
jgi:hypothetical protein